MHMHTILTSYDDIQITINCDDEYYPITVAVGDKIYHVKDISMHYGMSDFDMDYFTIPAAGLEFHPYNEEVDGWRAGMKIDSVDVNN